MALKNRRETSLHGNPDFQIRPSRLQQRNCRCGKDAIAQRSQSDDAHSAPRSELLEDVDLCGGRQTRVEGWLVGHYGFVNQHHGNIVPDRIDASATNTFQAGCIGIEFDLRFTRGADQDFEKVGT